MEQRSPLRIAIFSDSILPVLNGVSVSVDSLVQELRNAGHSVHVFAPRFPHHREHDPNTYRFRSIQVPWAKGFPIAYPPYYRMLRRFRKHEFDLVHTHTIGVMGFIGLRWAQSHELPIVSTYHTLYDRYAHYLEYLPRRYVRFKIAKHTNFYYNRVDHVLTPSEASLKWLRRHSVATPATVIPTGIRAPGFFDRYEIRQELGMSADQRVLLFVGRVAIEKNMEMLLRSAQVAMQQDQRIRLWVVGDGPYREAFQRLARELQIGDRVKMVGFVPRHKVDAYYAAADLFVFSSFTETQGLVIQEAMSYGLPAIVVDGGGASAGIVNGVSGCVVKNLAEEFGSKIIEVLGNDNYYSALSSGARKQVRDNLPNDMASRVIDVYESVLDRRKSLDAMNYAAIQ